MDTSTNTGSNAQNGQLSPDTDFSSMIHSGNIPKDIKAKKMAAEYSLSLIKASDPLINSDEEKTPDVNASIAVIREFGSKKVENAVVDKYPCSNEMLKELIKDHERIITQLKKNMTNYYERYNTGIKNLVNGIIEEHKTVAWTLKRLLVG
ncbi:MAG TPA: hypothetical protein VF868_07240 [Bacteroidia bacterium]|jgi:hypothetical protein